MLLHIYRLQLYRYSLVTAFKNTAVRLLKPGYFCLRIPMAAKAQLIGGSVSAWYGFIVLLYSQPGTCQEWKLAAGHKLGFLHIKL
jgi:hypothetical protein